jgi:hypothetical protein
VILWMSLFGETFHAYPRLIRWTFPQFIEREIELVTMVHSCLSGPHISPSFGSTRRNDNSGSHSLSADRKPLSRTSQNFSTGMGSGPKAPKRRPKRERKTLQKTTQQKRTRQKKTQATGQRPPGPPGQKPPAGELVPRAQPRSITTFKGAPSAGGLPKPDGSGLPSDGPDASGASDDKSPGVASSSRATSTPRKPPAKQPPAHEV